MVNSPNMAKRVLLAVLGAAAGAVTVTSTMSSGAARPLPGGTDLAGGSTTNPGGTTDTGSSSNGTSTDTPGGTTNNSPAPVATPAGVSGTFTGDAAQDGPWGSITVTITVKNNRVVDCAMEANVYDGQSQFINTRMSDWNTGLTVPEALKRQTLKAQSAQISGVSGATYTSYAYSQSLASALQQAGL